VGAANAAAQGKAEEEALVASAKGVAAATARLVYASRTKADPFSPTQKNLSAAAKNVAAATGSLVQAAKSATQLQEEEDSKPNWEESSNQAQQRKAEMEAQVKILRLQKELEKERVHLGDIRKAEYKDANVNVSMDQAANSPVRKNTIGGGTAPLAQSPSGNNNNANTPMKRNPSTETAAPLRKNPSESQSPGAAAAPQPVGSGRALPTPGGQPAARPAAGTAGRPPAVAGKVQPPGTTRNYTLKELQTKPAELDREQLEKYMSDEEFVQVFGMDKAAFERLPMFKRNSEKKTQNLY